MIYDMNLVHPQNEIIERIKELIRLYIYSFRVSPFRLLAPHTTSRCYEYSFCLVNLPEEQVERILDVVLHLSFLHIYYVQLNPFLV